MDAQTVSVAMGLIFGLLFAEAFGLAAGGMITPGYFALAMNRPADIALTLLAALITFALLRGVSRVAIVYGRRRIAITILLGFLVGVLIRGACGGAITLSGAEDPASHLAVIGFIIPGLIALWMDRQGTLHTLGVLAGTTAAVRLALIILGVDLMVMC